LEDELTESIIALVTPVGALYPRPVMATFMLLQDSTASSLDLNRPRLSDIPARLLILVDTLVRPAQEASFVEMRTEAGSPT
jgi:hypothetical protein